MIGGGSGGGGEVARGDSAEESSVESWLGFGQGLIVFSFTTYQESFELRAAERPLESVYQPPDAVCHGRETSSLS